MIKNLVALLLWQRMLKQCLDAMNVFIFSPLRKELKAYCQRVEGK